MAKTRVMEIAKRDKELYYMLTVLMESIENLMKTAVKNNGYCIVDRKKLNFTETVFKKANSLMDIGGVI